MIYINKIAGYTGSSIHTQPLLAALKELYAGVVAKFGEGSPEAIEAKRKYADAKASTVLVERPIDTPDGLTVCFVNHAAGYARTDTVIQPAGLQGLLQNVTTVTNWTALLAHTTANGVNKPEFFYMEEEGRTVWVIPQDQFNNDLVYQTTFTLRPDGATFSTLTGVESNGHYNLELRDRVITGGKGNIQISIFATSGDPVDRDDLETIAAYQIVEPFMKNRSPYWASMKTSLDERLALLEKNDPFGELTISKERYEPLDATSPDHALSFGGIDVMVVRKTGFMRVGVNVEPKSFYDILKSQNVQVEEVNTILPFSQHINNGLSNTLYMQADGGFGIKVRGETLTRDFIQVLGGISFASIVYEEFPTPGFDEDFITGYLKINDPAIIGGEVVIPVFDKKTITDPIEENEIVVYPNDKDVTTLKEGKEVDLFNFTIINYEPKKDGLLESESVLIVGGEEVELLEDVYVIESTINHVVLVKNLFNFEVDVSKRFNIRTNLFVNKDGVRTQIATVNLVDLKAVLDRKRFVVASLDHKGGTTECQVTFSDYDKPAPLTEEQYQTCKLGKVTGLLTTQGEQLGYDRFIKVGTFQGRFAAISGTTVNIETVSRLLTHKSPFLMPYKAADFDIQQTSATLVNRRLKSEFLITPKEFPSAASITELYNVTTDKWLVYTPATVDFNVTGTKFIMTLDFHPDAWTQDDVEVTWTPTVLLETPQLGVDGVAVSGAGKFLLEKSNYDLVFSEINHTYDHTAGTTELTFKVRSRTNKIVKNLDDVRNEYSVDGSSYTPIVSEYNNDTGVFRFVYKPVFNHVEDVDVVVDIDVTDYGQWFGTMHFEGVIDSGVELEITARTPLLDLESVPPTITWRFAPNNPRFGDWDNVSMDMPVISANMTVGGVQSSDEQTWDPVGRVGSVVFPIIVDDKVDVVYQVNAKYTGINAGVTFHAEEVLEYVLPATGGFVIAPGVLKLDGRAVTQEIQISNKDGLKADRAEILTFDSVTGIQDGKNTPDTEAFDQPKQTYTFTATTVPRPAAPLEIGFQGDLFVNDIPLPFKIKKIVPYISIKQNSEKMVGNRAVATAILHDTADVPVTADVKFALLNMTNSEDDPDFTFHRVNGSSEWELSAAAKISNSEVLTYQFSIEAETKVEGTDITVPGALTVTGMFVTPEDGMFVTEKDFVLTDKDATVTLSVTMKDGSYPMAAKLDTNFSIHTGTKPGATAPKAWDYNPATGELVFIWDIVDVPGTRYEFASKVQFPAYPGQADVPFTVEKSSAPLPVPLSVTRKTETLTGDVLHIVNVFTQQDGKFPADLEMIVPVKIAEGTTGGNKTPISWVYNPATGELSYTFNMVLPLKKATINYDVKVPALRDYVQNVNDVATGLIVVDKVYTHTFVDQYLEGDRVFGVYDFMVDGSAATGISQYALVGGENLAQVPDFQFAADPNQANRVIFSSAVVLPAKEDEWPKYVMTVEATNPDNKTETLTVNAEGTKWNPPVDENGNSDPTISLRSFVIAEGFATVEYNLRMADGSFPVGAKFELPLEIATNTAGPVEPQNATYNPKTGVAKFVVAINVDETQEVTYHFAGNISLWPYNGDLLLHFDNQQVVVPSKGVLTVTNVALAVKRDVGALSMNVAYSDGTFPEAVTLVTPVDRVTGTAAGTKDLTNIQYSKATGVLKAEIATVKPAAGGTNYLVAGKLYPTASPADISTYEATAQAIAEYRVEWDEPVFTKKQITQAGRIVMSPDAAKPTTVSILPIAGAIGLVGVNPTSQTYDSDTLELSYVAEAKELTTVPVLYKYTVVVDIDGEQHSNNVERNINPLRVVAGNAKYYNGVLTVDYDFYDDNTPSDFDIQAELTSFQARPPGGDYTPEFTWARKGSSLPGRFTWVATYTVPLHDSTTSRWDWTLLFKYQIDNTLNAEIVSTGYKGVETVPGGTSKFRTNPAYEQKGAPVGTSPVMHTTWLVDCLDSAGNKPLKAELLGAISGSGTANNGLIESQSYDPATGILTIVNTYYGSSTDAKSISASGAIRFLVPGGFETSAVTGASFTIPAPIPFSITEVKDFLAADRKELKITFKVVPQNGVYPVDITMKIPFTAAQKTLGGTRYPKNVGTTEAPKYWEYDPATGIGSFIFEMAATALDGDILRFTTDVYGKKGNINKDTNFDITLNGDYIWLPTHKRTKIEGTDAEITYVIARPSGVFPEAVTVTGFDAPSGITGNATGVTYDPATGTVVYHVALAKAPDNTMARVVFNPIFNVDSKELKPKLTHDIYGYKATVVSNDYNPATKLFRSFSTVKRMSDSVDAVNGTYRLANSDPAATGGVVTSKVTGTPLKWGAEWTVTGAKDDDKTVFTFGGDFTTDVGNNLFMVVPWTGTYIVFLNAPGYVNINLKDALLKGNELTIRCDTAWGPVQGHPVGTAYSDKPFSYALPNGNNDKTPIRESFDSASGVYTFVFKVDAAFANTGGAFSFDGRLNFPAYGDNVTKPGLSARFTPSGNVTPTLPVVFTPVLQSAVFTGNQLVETVKYTSQTGTFPNDVSAITMTTIEGAVVDTTKPAVYDKTTGLFVTTYTCSVPTDAVPVVVKTGFTSNAGNEEGTLSVYAGTYTHELYKAASVAAELQTRALILDYEVTASGAAIDNLVLGGVSYSNSQGNGSLLAHTAGAKAWRLNMPNNGNRPFNSAGTGTFTRAMGGKVSVNIPFVVDYRQPLTPDTKQTSQVLEGNLFSQNLTITVAEVFPATAKITSLTVKSGFLPAVSNMLSQSYNPATGTLAWSALLTPPSGNFASDLEGDLNLDLGNGVTQVVPVKFKMNSYWLREMSTGWLNGNLQRVYYLTMNGGMNTGRPGQFIARNFAPADPQKSVGTVHNGSDVDWTLVTNAAQPAIDKNTVYNGDGVLQISELDKLTVNLPWTFTYTNVPPKSPYVATLNKVTLKDDVATLDYTLKNNTNDFPETATITKFETAQNSLNGTLDPKSVAYEKTTGALTVKYDAKKIPTDLSMLLGVTGDVKTELVDVTKLTGTRRAWDYNVTTTGYKWVANNLQMNHNLNQGANSAMPKQGTYVFGALTNVLPGGNRAVCEHLNNEAVYKTTYAVTPPDAGGTRYLGNGWIIVPGNSENAEVHVSFTIDHTATAIPVNPVRNAEIRDITWDAGKVKFHIMCREADGSFSPAAILGPNVTRVYTPARQDGAGVEAEVYDPLTGILVATFSGAGPTTDVPSDIQVSGTIKFGATPLDVTVGRTLDNRAFKGGIHHP